MAALFTGGAMAGYRPDDEWALTDESGERIDGGWKVILAVLGVLIAAIVIGELAGISIGVFVAIGIFVGMPALCIWKIVTGLRAGVVSVRYGSYSRAEHPIYYWTLMAVFAALAVWLVGLIILIGLHGQ
jgi:hypothetical protein